MSYPPLFRFRDAVVHGAVCGTATASRYTRLITYVFAGCLSLAGSSVVAQTRFDWPDSRIQLGKYSFLETCLAVSSRVRDSLRARTVVLTDTLYYTQHNAMGPLSRGIVDATQRCLVPFQRDQIAPDNLFLAQELYLIAEQDSNAAALVRRRLGAIPQADTTQRAAVLDTAIMTYLTAKPPRLVTAQTLFDQLTDIMTFLPYSRRLYLHGQMFTVSETAKDSLAMRRYGAASIAVSAKVFDEGKTEMDLFNAKASARVITYKLHRMQLMDSLRVSTSAMRALQDALYMQAMGGHKNDDTRIARPAATVSGDFWFPETAARITYPRPGRVTLVGIVRTDSDIGGGEMEIRTLIKRLASRFPEMDVVLIARTQGYFGSAEPPDPGSEAKLINQLFREFRDLPVTLAVSNTPFWRLPRHDRRRIDDVTPNEAFYHRFTHGSSVLIDEKGLVVFESMLDIRNEKYFEDVIGILLKRSSQSH